MQRTTYVRYVRCVRYVQGEQCSALLVRHAWRRQWGATPRHCPTARTTPPTLPHLQCSSPPSTPCLHAPFAQASLTRAQRQHEALLRGPLGAAESLVEALAEREAPHVGLHLIAREGATGGLDESLIGASKVIRCC